MDFLFKPGRRMPWPTADLAERFAEGQATEEELRRAWEEKERFMREDGHYWDNWPEMAVVIPDALDAALGATGLFARPWWERGAGLAVPVPR